MAEFFKYVFLTLMYRGTGNEAIDTFIYYTSFWMEVAGAIGILLLVLRSETLRKGRRSRDRLMFWECVLVFTQCVLDISLVPLVAVEARWADYTFYTLLVLNEVLYLLIVMQWLVCVDYALHRSMDHIRRRYRHAALPILIVTALDVIHSFVSFSSMRQTMWGAVGVSVLHTAKLFIELGYIMTAIFIVKRYEKDRREPHFLRLDAFIIPFVIGALVRYYDAPLLALGVILTYAAMKRRDKYIDFASGFYNDAFLDCVATHWDKKGYADGNALFIAAQGHADALAQLLKNIKIPDCFIIKMADGSFLMLTGPLRASAFKLTEETLKTVAGQMSPPFTVGTLTLRRGEDMSMQAFADEIRKKQKTFVPQTKEEVQAE